MVYGGLLAGLSIFGHCHKLRDQDLNEKAGQYAREAYEIRRRLHGPSDADMGQSLYNMARLYQAEKDYERAEKYYKQTLQLDEEKLGSDDPRTIMTRKCYIELLHQMGNNDEAKQQEELLKD